MVNKVIIDCFTFFNEIDLLEGRLEYLYNVVDRFVIVESNRTHSCKLKPLNFKENESRYSKYMDKITYLVWENNQDSTPDAWIQENAQRNYILEGLKDINAGHVMVSDIDEIPNRNMINVAISSTASDWFTFRQQMFFYNLKQRTLKPWSGSIITTVPVLKEKTPQWFRNNRTNGVHIEDGGWHLSYWGSPEAIQYKIDSFAHQELNNDQWKNVDSIKQRIFKGQDPYERDRERIPEHRVIMQPMDRKDLDSDLVKYFGKYEVIT